MSLKIADNLKLPPDIAGRRTAVFGISGSGKSNTATAILEELSDAGEQFVLIDPKGEGWGLLSLANGKPSSIDVIIFGEPRGHITALTEHHGPQIADFVVDSGRSVVLSLTGFESDTSERRFVSSFLRKLYRNKSQLSNRTRTLVVFEEAHLFVPEGAGAGFKGDVAELVGACQRIVRQGRSFGLGSLIVDQRPQDVAKRVLTQCDTIICHQLVHNKDRDALAAWIDANADSTQGKEFLASLSSLQEGDAWVWSPKLDILKRVHMRMRRTFDSGAAPDGSETLKVSRKEIDLAALGKQLNELVEKAKADDPKLLRQTIAELRKQLAGKPTAAPDQSAFDRAIEAAVAKRDREWQASIREHSQIIESLKGRMGKAVALLNVNGEAMPKTAIPAKVTQPALQVQRPARVVTQRALPSGDESIGGGLRRMMVALAQRPGLSARQLGVRAGLSSSSGTFGTYLARGRSSGWIDGDRNRLALTDAGVAALGRYDPLPEGRALAEYWLGQLGGGERRIFEALLGSYPQALSKEELGQQSGLSAASGTFGTYLSRLRTLELVQGRGELKASEELF